MSAIQVYGPYNRANNLAKAFGTARHWLKLSAMSAVVILVANSVARLSS